LLYPAFNHQLIDNCKFIITLWCEIIN